MTCSLACQATKPPCSIRDEIARHLLHRGVRQWNPGELPIEWIEDRIRAGSVYLVCRGARLVASATITNEDPRVWGQQSAATGYIHLLMVDRAFAGHGVGRSLLGWCEAQIRGQGKQLSRLDCVLVNDRLRRYYEQAGYVLVVYKSFPESPWADVVALYEKDLGQ